MAEKSSDDGLVGWLIGGLLVGIVVLGLVAGAYAIGFDRGKDEGKRAVAGAPPASTTPTDTEPTTTEPTTTEPTTTEPQTTEPTTDTGTTTSTEPATTGTEDVAAQGKQIFTSAGCAGCHTLADAGATGAVGPNLDTVKPKPSQQLVVDRVTNGLGAMPAFAGQLSDAEIQAVATYVAQASG